MCKCGVSPTSNRSKLAEGKCTQEHKGEELAKERKRKQEKRILGKVCLGGRDSQVGNYAKSRDFCLSRVFYLSLLHSFFLIASTISKAPRQP